jgi:hypothetical protein
LSNNFIDDLDFTAQYPINPALLKSFHSNPYDQLERIEMKKYINANILDLLMIDNLLQSAKIENSHYILHEDFRPYDKSAKDSKRYSNIYDEAYDDTDKWAYAKDEYSENLKTRFKPKNFSNEQTIPSKIAFLINSKTH